MPNKSPPLWAYSLPSALLLMAPFDLLSSLAMDVYLPVIPEMPVALGTSPAIVQLTLSVYMLVLGLGQILFGPLSDRIGRRPVVLGGAFFFAASSFALAMTSNAPLFVTLRVLQALGASATLVATFATVRDVYADRPEGSVIYSLFGSMLAFVPALGPILGSFIAVELGWRAIFVMLGVFGSLAFGHALPKWHETRPCWRGSETLVLRSILGNASFWIYTLGFSTAMGAFFVFFSTAPRVLIERLGLSQMWFSAIFSTVALVMILTTRLASRFVSHWGIEGCLIRGLLVILIGASILMGCSLLTELSVLTFVPPMWLIAVGMVFIVSVTANGALQDFSKTAGTAVAFYYCGQSLIVGGFGTAVIVILPGDSAWPLIAYCLTSSAVTLLALMINRSMRHQS
ncbi:Bicyclomycin resistance protein [compost metagenome]